MSTMQALTMNDLCHRYHLTQREILLYMKPAGLPIHRKNGTWYARRGELVSWEKKQKRISFGKGQYYSMELPAYESVARRQRKLAREQQKEKDKRWSGGPQDWGAIIKWAVIITAGIVAICGVITMLLDAGIV